MYSLNVTIFCPCRFSTFNFSASGITSYAKRAREGFNDEIIPKVRLFVAHEEDIILFCARPLISGRVFCDDEDDRSRIRAASARAAKKCCVNRKLHHARARKIACARVGVITSDYDSNVDKRGPITCAIRQSAFEISIMDC